MPGLLSPAGRGVIQEATSESSPAGGLRQDGEEDRGAGQRSRAFRRVRIPWGPGTLISLSILPPDPVGRSLIPHMGSGNMQLVKHLAGLHSCGSGIQPPILETRS